ncbi:MAG: DUF151 domain-containing protein [Porphyromonadaceae bacterium]|nr:DUF151 domain-containing protein [Porphyromonadaceae bacterium]
MDEKVALNVLGITYNRSQPDTYILILVEDGGVRQLPIAIRFVEAQSIMACIQRIIPQRPLTHDLFSSFAKAYGIQLQEAYIYHYEEGLFSSEMIFNNGEREVHIDARASDAVALAMRMQAPIYTTPSVLEKAGITPDQIASLVEKESGGEGIETYSTEELKRQLQQSIEREEYEQAAVIQRELKKREGKKPVSPID